jgi:hypothetical protein
MTDFPNNLNPYPAVSPYVAAIPKIFRQGDSLQWVDVPFTDVNGIRYDSSGYTLKYTLAGPSAPLVLTATANGSSWQTNLTTTASAALAPGLYSWTAQAFATGVRVTLSEGEITVEPDLALAGANYDGRSVAEAALAAAESALAQFQASGGRMREYTIGGRHMVFQSDADLLKVVQYWRARVISDKTAASGGTSRLILTRFQRAR